MILSIYSTYCPELNSWSDECLYEFEGETRANCYMQFKEEGDDLARVFSSAFDILKENTDKNDDEAFNLAMAIVMNSFACTASFADSENSEEVFL